MWELNGESSDNPLIFLGHRHESTGIAWSKYSETVATCSDDTQVIIWDIERDEQLLTKMKQENLITCFVDPDSVNCVGLNSEYGICKNAYYGSIYGSFDFPKSSSMVGSQNNLDLDPVRTKKQLNWIVGDESKLRTPLGVSNYFENSKDSELISSPSTVGVNSKCSAIKVRRRQSTLLSGTKIQSVKKRQSKTYNKIIETTPSITNYFKNAPK
jgi:WD40 repeat protein